MRIRSQKNYLAQFPSPGFTLVETVITISFFVVILLVILSQFDQYMGVYSSQQALSRIGTSSSVAMSEMQALILQATRVMSSQTISGTSYSSDSDTLVLELPAINASGDIVSGTFDYAAIYTSGTNVYRVISAAGTSSRPSGTKILTDSLNSLTFTYDAASASDSTSVDVVLNTQLQARHQTLNYSLHHKIYLRNL